MSMRFLGDIARSAQVPQVEEPVAVSKEVGASIIPATVVLAFGIAMFPQ